MSLTRDRRLWLIVAVHLALGALYAWATPVFEAPDEGYHVAVARWIALGRGLPVQTPGVSADYAQEGSQPPLYYLLAAGLLQTVDLGDWDQVFVKNPRSQIGVPGTAHNVNDYKPAPPDAAPWAGTRGGVYLLRAFSLLLNAATLVGVAVVARQAGADRTLMLLAVALAAFNPMMLFIGASANNDNLLRALSTAGLGLSLRALEGRPLSRRWLAGLGVVLGLAALAKLSGLVLWPVAALALARDVLNLPPAERRPAAVARRLASVIPRFIVVFGVALAVCGWWYARNALLYGDPTGLNAMIAVAGPRAIALGEVLTQEWYGFYLSFWALFGVFTLLPDAWAQWFFHTLTVAALAGGAWAAWRARRRWTPAGLLLAFFAALTLVGVIRWTMQTPASQGRLMFGAIAPLMLGLAAGLLALFPARWRPAAAGGWGGALALAAALQPITVIAPAYAPPPPLAAADLPADMRPVRARLGAGLELVGYTSVDAPLAPGAAQTVTLYWRALEPMSADYTLALVLFGRAGQSVGQIDTWPGAGRLPTTYWQAGAYYADTYRLPVAAAASAPTLLRLGVGAWDQTPEQRLPLSAADGAALTAITAPVGRLIPAAAPPAAPARPDGSRFEYDLTLLGYDAVVEHTPGQGGALALTLYWRAGQTLPADYTVFIHFVDTQGVAVLPPADAPPLAGDWPTSAWLAGQVVRDERLIALPADLPPDCCRVRLGWYDAASGARLLAWQPDGEPWADNAVTLTGLLEHQP